MKNQSNLPPSSLTVMLISEDNQEFVVSMEAAFMSNLVKSHADESIADWDRRVKISDVKGSALATVLEYCNKHTEKQLEISEIKEWDDEYCKMDADTLFDVVSAANHMGVQDLLRLTRKAVADRAGRKVDDFRTMLEEVMNSIECFPMPDYNMKLRKLAKLRKLITLRKLPINAEGAHKTDGTGEASVDAEDDGKSDRTVEGNLDAEDDQTEGTEECHVVAEAKHKTEGADKTDSSMKLRELTKLRKLPIDAVYAHKTDGTEEANVETDHDGKTVGTEEGHVVTAANHKTEGTGDDHKTDGADKTDEANIDA